MSIQHTQGGNTSTSDPWLLDLGTHSYTAGNHALFLFSAHGTTPAINTIEFSRAGVGTGTFLTKIDTFLISGEAYWELWEGIFPSTGNDYELDIDPASSIPGGSGYLLIEHNGDDVEVGSENTGSYSGTITAMPVISTADRPQIIFISAHNDSNYLNTSTIDDGFTVGAIASRALMCFKESASGVTTAASIDWDGVSEAGEALTFVVYTVGNQAPVVDAGPDQNLTWPTNIAFTAGSATDDGLPDPPAALTYAWTVVSKPTGSNVVFADATDPTTQVTVDKAGIYVFRLTADDSELTGQDDVTITFASGVSAGPDQTITLPPGETFLQGSTEDPTVGITWTKISGPGTVTFVDATDRTTGVSFTATGTYVLRITTDTGEWDEMTVTVVAFIDPDAACPSGEVEIFIDGVNQTSRLKLEGLSIEYTLHSRGILEATVLDKQFNPISAWRPVMHKILYVQRGVMLFKGRIIDFTEAPLLDSDNGTGYKITAADYVRGLESRLYASEYGQYRHVVVTGTGEDTEYELVTDLRIVSVGTGSPATVTTETPHYLQTGDTVRLTGVVDVFPVLEDTEFAITKTGESTFTIAQNVTVAGTSGAVLKLTRLNVIVSDLASVIAGHYGISWQTAGVGPWITPRKFRFQSVAEILSDICQEAGWIWRVTPDKILQVFEPGTIFAPFSLDGDNVEGATEQIRSRGEYANTIRVFANSGTGDHEYQEVFTGDGTSRRFSLVAFPIEDTAIRSPGQVWDYQTSTFKTVGIYGYDTQFEWVYRRFNNSLYQLEVYGSPPVATSPLAAGEQVRFVYQGEAEFSVEVTNVAALAADDGEPYELRIDGGNRSVDSARIWGGFQLAKYVIDVRKLRLLTRECFGLPGSAIPVELPRRGIDADWIILSTSIASTEAVADGVSRVGPDLLYTYEVLENASVDTWLDFWRRLRR